MANKTNFFRPWETSVYITQCKTASIANEITGIYENVTPMASIHKPPFCLRILKPYRTKEMQVFRDLVADKAREYRRFKWAGQR